MSIISRFARRGAPKGESEPGDTATMNGSDPADEGRMTLVEHLRELRTRLFKAVGAIVIGTVVGLYFYEELFGLLHSPIKAAIEEVAAQRNIDAKINFGNVASPLMLALKIGLLTGLVATCPIWLYQLWAFVVPGLHRNERKWTLLFVGTAAPLFIGGVVLGYFAMPLGISVLLDFTPANLDLSNYIDVDYYLSFVLRLLIVFGVAFEIPIFVIMLNLVGVLSAKRLARWRAPIVFGIFVFAAVATPSIDPLTMLLLAGPMCVLFILSEFAARLFERRRRARMAAQGFDVDELDI